MSGILTRRAGIAALLAAALLAGAWFRSGAHGTPGNAVAATDAQAAPSAVAPGPPPAATSPQRAVATGTLGPQEPAPPPRLTAADYSHRYADAMCECTTAACVEEVRVRFSLDLGRMIPTRDDQAMKEGFARARVCAHKVLDSSG